MRCAVLALAGWFVVPHASAQVDQVVTAKLERYSVAALVTHQEGAKALRRRGERSRSRDALLGQDGRRPVRRRPLNRLLQLMREDL